MCGPTEEVSAGTLQCVLGGPVESRIQEHQGVYFWSDRETMG
jgi:hypothetical protein